MPLPPLDALEEAAPRTLTPFPHQDPSVKFGMFGEQLVPEQGTPLPRGGLQPALVPTAADTVEFQHYIERALALPGTTVARAIVALSTGRNLLIAGPPRSGRASLARVLSRRVLGWDEEANRALRSDAASDGAVALIEEVQELGPEGVEVPATARLLFTATLTDPSQAMELAARLPGKPVPILLFTPAPLEREQEVALEQASRRAGLDQEALAPVAEPMFRWWRRIREHGPAGTGVLVDLLTQTAFFLARPASAAPNILELLPDLIRAELGPLLVAWDSPALVGLLRSLSAEPKPPVVLLDLLQELLAARVADH